MEHQTRIDRSQVVTVSVARPGIYVQKVAEGKGHLVLNRHRTYSKDSPVLTEGKTIDTFIGTFDVPFVAIRPTPISSDWSEYRTCEA